MSHPSETIVNNILPLLGQTPFLVTYHSSSLGIDRRLDWEKEERLEEFVGFYLNNGTCVHLYHQQDCCETVTLIDCEGELSSLRGGKLLLAEESQQSGTNEYDPEKGWQSDESYTWSFYRFATEEGGHVTLRFYGFSNGYYSEQVDIIENRVDFSVVMAEKAKYEKDKIEQAVSDTLSQKHSNKNKMM